MMAGPKLTILVSGMVGAVPHQGGASWAVLQYILGLRRLDHEVFFVEEVDTESLWPPGVSLAQSDNAAYFRRVMATFGLLGRSSMLLAGTTTTTDFPYEELRHIANRSHLLLNVSGRLTDQELTHDIPLRVYVDVDPAFTQLWALQGIDMRFDGHTHFATVGLAIGTTDCRVPTCERAWITTAPPVILAEWSDPCPIVHDALTTVANWRSYGSVEHAGTHYGQKAHSFRRFIDLPKRTPERYMIALALDEGESRDRAALCEAGWKLIPPARFASTPQKYKAFVQGSKAEIGIAKSGYVASRCGWFSDRSVCYLASGRPVIAQETGFSRCLPTGDGLFSFTTYDDVLAATESLRSNYHRHSRAARAVAVEHFDSDKVLSHLLQVVGAA